MRPNQSTLYIFAELLSRSSNIESLELEIKWNTEDKNKVNGASIENNHHSADQQTYHNYTLWTRFFPIPINMYIFFQYNYIFTIEKSYFKRWNWLNFSPILNPIVFNFIVFIVLGDPIQILLSVFGQYQNSTGLVRLKVTIKILQLCGRLPKWK